MRAQTKYTFQIGIPTRNRRFEKQIVTFASLLCGGCTTSIKDGWWCADGADHKETFEIEPEREVCFELELTCEQGKAEMVYSRMCRHVSLLAARLGVDTNWVHVTETQMVGRHFSVQQTVKALKEESYV